MSTVKVELKRPTVIGSNDVSGPFKVSICNVSCCAILGDNVDHPVEQ